MLAYVMNHDGILEPQIAFLDEVWVKFFTEKKRLQSKILQTAFRISPIFFHVYAARPQSHEIAQLLLK